MSADAESEPAEMGGIWVKIHQVKKFIMCLRGGKPWEKIYL